MDRPDQRPDGADAPPLSGEAAAEPRPGGPAPRPAASACATVEAPPRAGGPGADAPGKAANPAQGGAAPGQGQGQQGRGQGQQGQGRAPGPGGKQGGGQGQGGKQGGGQGQGNGPPRGQGQGQGNGPRQGQRQGQGQGQGQGNLPARMRQGGPGGQQGGQLARHRPGGVQGGGQGGGPPRPTIVIDLPASEGARSARRRGFWRRMALWLSFIVMVLAPAGGVTWYLWARAADQYASEVSFAVRALDSTLPSPVMELLGGGGGDSTAGDSQMLYEYLQSQPLVEKLDKQIDLRAIYNNPKADWLFRLGDNRTIEELVFYWNLAVTVSYDSGGGIIYVQVKAFDPEDAQRVARALVAESERLINDLSTRARQDAVSYAVEDLREAEARVREMRKRLQVFRMAEGSADIAQDIVAAMTLIAELKSQRSLLKADYDSRKGLLGPNSPTLSALKRQIESLDAQIAQEENLIANKSGAVAGDGSQPSVSLTDAIGEQEELLVELRFAENMYTSTLAAVETARADARRAQRYLATHIAPTRSEEAEYPSRITWSLAAFFLLLIVWSILLLIISSIRDRN